MKTHLITDPCHCLALRQAARAASIRYDRHLEPAGLTTSQFSLLAVVHHNPCISTQDLADQMVMDRTTLVRAVKPLARDGYIDQSPDAQNTRKLVFSLTAEGQRKYQEAHVYWMQAQAEFEADIGKSRAEAIRAELRDLTKNHL